MGKSSKQARDEMIEHRILIDWMRFTLDATRDTQRFVETFGLMVEDAAPVGFYNKAISVLDNKGDKIGKIEWNTDVPLQKVCYTFSGRDLDRWREQGRIEALLGFVVDHKGKFTRIDVAIDVLQDERATVQGLVALMKLGRVKTGTKTHSVIQSTRDGVEGTTLYLGSRQSDKFARIYDKAAEQGILAQWIRIELECKGDYACAMGPRLLSDGLEFGRGEIVRFVDFDCEWWAEATHTNIFSRVEVDRTPGNRRRWQNEVLFGMVVDAIEENEDFRKRLETIMRRRPQA